ncbi:DNA polymerase/3'-5' exonuclease PolX [Candidatus Woesearchaeota archaeon]|nr:DNA polymerase/3'-5' exonuclease PolX [Candidatus Woesearchaeota archaeon]MBW3016664.1 DNA polymerase/3'-5' exonuclease PolX [Candidatus Woesearchaeota archaeon]
MGKNREIADMFYEMADVLEMQGVDWKPAAYRKAARSLDTLSEPVEKIYASGGVKALKDIPGVGESLALKIEEFLKTGKIREFENLVKKIPSGVEEMMHVPGLGPKKVMRLYKELKIKSVRDLERAAKSGRLRKLEGFGVKSEEDILRGLNILKKGVGRTLLGFALPVAREICAKLSNIDGVKKVEPAGSLRRMNETVGDIDILVISSKPVKVMNFFTGMPEVESVLAMGSTKSTVILSEGLQADVRVLDDQSFGAALQYFTGSKDHNISLRQIAIKKGFKLSEYGLFKKNRYVCGRSEKEIYSRLGLSFVPPELRENHGEIEAALRKKLPDLIPYNAIKGDLQMHSKWSDGSYSIEEMARAAQKMGYKYMAITDHSKSEHIAHGMEEKRLLQYLKEIDKVQKKVSIRILKGSEVDILTDGSLDYENRFLKELDFVLASVHSRFKSSSKDMTKRILKAFDNPYVNALAHPTGRLINRREPYEFDFDKVALAAKERGIALEANAYPDRLDLKDVHIHRALELGCKISIGTDSHSVEHLRFMEFGVAQARRGWAQKKAVINAWPLKKLEKFLRK